MLDFAQTQYDELLMELENRERSSGVKGFSPRQRLGLIFAAVDRIKEKLNAQPFADDDEEASFFKKFFPLFLSEIIYYTEKFNLESMRLVGSPAAGHEYLECQFRKMDDFFKAHTEFLKYYQSGRTDLDKYYFLRSSAANQENMELLIALMDPRYCTVYSVKVATILAYARLEADILCSLAGNNAGTAVAVKNEFRLTWTDPKAGLSELIYALWAEGAFNNGKAGLKEITDYFQKVFSVQLGNISRSFQEILCRKTGPTTYLDKIKNKLNNKITELEQAHIR